MRFREKKNDRKGDHRSSSNAAGLHLPKAIDLDGTTKLRIVLPTRGHSLRTVITGARVITTGIYASRRMQIGIPVEGATDLMGTMCSEVETEIVRYRAQPFRIELMTGSSILRSIPDCLRQRADGGWEIVEYKASWRQFRSESAKQQSVLARMAANAIGADYLPLVRERLGSEARLKNIEMVQLYRFVNVPLSRQHIAAEMLSCGEPVPLGRLTDALHDNPANGFALVCSLMVQRQVSIDLEDPLSRDSAVTGVEPDSQTHDIFEALRCSVPVAA